jgi:beta-N-acetylhexosaminidase
MRATALAAVALATILLTGCAVGPPPARTDRRSESATSSPAKTADPIAAYASARLANMTLPQKVASLLMLHQPGTDGVALRSFVDRYGVGGMILMSDNIPATPNGLAAQNAEMTASDPELPPLVALDEEGGDVTRLPWDTLPGADVLKMQPPAATRTVFGQRAALLEAAGVTVNFGTVADTTADTRSFIFDRVLGTTPAAASDRVAASVTGERGAVLSTLKHFPGHGETEADSHSSIPTTTVGLADWQARDAAPFVSGTGAGAELVMFGHLVYSAVDAAPASLSAPWHRILNDQLGFHGVSVTDDMRMLQDSGLPQYANPRENAVRAIAAGNTMLLYVLPADPASVGLDPQALIDAIAEAVVQGRIPAAQIDADARKLLELRRSLAVKRVTRQHFWESPE